MNRFPQSRLCQGCLSRSSRPQRWHRSALAALALALSVIGVAHAQPVSPAETLLFETDHLGSLKAPATLVYTFGKVSNVEPAFSDTVQLDLTDVKGKRHVALRFLSGARQHVLPALEDAHGNPVLLGFLERDIAEMARLTGGSPTYFRKRIRMALAAATQLTRQALTYRGKTLQGTALRIQPFLDDPLRKRFEPYARKTYTFIVSDQVPGGIYQLATTLANPGAALTVSARASAAPANAAVTTIAPATPAPANAAVAATAPATTAPASAPAATRPMIDETLTLQRDLPQG